MKTYYLNGDDINKTEKLIKISKKINLIYDKLYNLEINNQKDSMEYKKQLNFLKLYLDLEKNVYNKINFGIDKILAIITYLMKFKFHKNHIAEEECLINQDYKNIDILRVMRKLLNRLENSKKGFKQIYISDTDKDLEENFDLVYKQIKIMKEINKDIYNSYLLFLQDYINKETNNSYKKDFIKSKYVLSFLYQNIENQMLESNFEITKDLYIGSKFLSDMFNIEQDMYNYIRDNYSKKVLEPYITNFINVSDLDYNNSKNYVSAIFNCCYIRACLLNMSNETIKEVNSDFHDLIDSEEYLNSHINDNISENLIVGCFKCVKKDKTKVKRLSFKIK